MAIIGQYTASGSIFRASDGLLITADPGNMDYQAMLAGVANGDTITAYVAPAAPLPDLQPYQFRAMLALSGNTDKLNAYIASLADPAKTIAQAKLDYSLSFQRNNSLVLAAQQALGLTDAQMDALWTEAAAIQ